MACASDVQASSRPRVAGLQGLPREVLVGILQAVKLAALGEQSTPEEDAAWQESFLVPLRAFAHGLRDAVDALVSARSLSVCPKGSRDIRTLRRVDDWLRHSPRRWPHLTALQLDLDWPADYLEFALMTIAGPSGCPLLSRLKLNVAHSPKGPRGRSVGSLDVGVLESLAHLSHLSLAGFSRYCSWSDGLDGLTSVEALELVDPGIPRFEMWPSMTSLAIHGRDDDTDKMELVLVLGLCHLSLSRLQIDILTVPESVETLEVERVCANDEWCFRGNLPNLETLKARNVDYTLLAELLRETDAYVLEVVAVFGLMDAPGLENFCSIKTLVWKDNDCPLPPSISTLTTLHELVLLDSESLQIPPLGALTCLEKLTIVVTEEIPAWPELTGLTRLTTLKLSNGSEQRWIELPLGLAGLVALEELSLERFHHLYKPDLEFLTRLPNLHCLTLSECRGVADVPHLGQLASLRTLHLANMPNLFDLRKLPSSLTSLSITNCPTLGRLPTLPSGNTLRQLTLERLSRSLVGQVTTLTTLEELTIRECPTLTSLTRLQGLSQLKAVTISKCPLVRVINVRQLPVLKYIKVYDCSALETVDGLTQRYRLTTTGCPQL